MINNNGKLIVLMLGNFPLEDLKGGVAVHTKQLVKSMGKIEDERIEFHVISFGKRSQIFQEGKVQIKIIKSHKIFYICPFLAILKLEREVKKIDPRIIHVQGSNLSPYLLYSLLFRSNSKKIITVHGLVQVESRYNKHYKLSIWKYFCTLVEKYAINNISEIIVCSPQMENLLRSMTNSDIHVIPNGIDTKHLNTFEINSSITRPSIFFIGMLRQVKGIEVLLNAMPAILKKIPNAQLYIAGTGPQECELKRLTEKLNVINNVTFLGFISEDQKYSLYKSTYISVFPSLYEPFGIVLLEAMACGKAIVASNVGGIPYIVDDEKTGLLFEPGNSQELAQKIILLLEDEDLREKLGKNGLRKARQFEWENIAIRTFDLYKSLTKN